MCNYNRQSKTKPFTFNELHLEGKGRLPQGGILMKQMAECSQGPTLPVLLFTVCQHFQHSKEFHLSPRRSSCVGEPFRPSPRRRGSDQVATLSWPVPVDGGPPEASRSPFATLWGAIKHTSKENKHCRQVSCILYFISSSTCAYWQCSFLPFSVRHTHAPQATARVDLSVVVEWFGPTSRGYTSSHTCAVPLLLFPHPFPLRISCVQCRKNRHPLINSKVVKILSSPKGCESSEEELNQSQPPRNIKVEPSGRKSIIKIRPENKRCCSCNTLEVTHRGHVMQMTSFSSKVMIMLGTLYIHTTWWAVLNILVWTWHHLLRESKMITEI